MTKLLGRRVLDERLPGPAAGKPAGRDYAPVHQHMPANSYSPPPRPHCAPPDQRGAGFIPAGPQIPGYETKKPKRQVPLALRSTIRTNHNLPAWYGPVGPIAKRL